MDCLHWINTLGLSTSVQPIISFLYFSLRLSTVTGPWWWWWWITSAANCLWILTLVFQFRMNATEVGFDAYSMQEINPNRRRWPADPVEQTNNRFILKPAPYSVSPHHQIKIKPPQIKCLENVLLSSIGIFSHCSFMLSRQNLVSQSGNPSPVSFWWLWWNYSLIGETSHATIMGFLSSE